MPAYPSTPQYWNHSEEYVEPPRSISAIWTCRPPCVTVSTSGQMPLMYPSESISIGIWGIPRGAGPAVFSIDHAWVLPPPAPGEAVALLTVTVPRAPTPASAEPPTTPLTNRRRPLSSGYLSSALMLEPWCG